MSELTPERIHDAADVLDALSVQEDPFATHTWSALAVRERANRLEREQAAEAQREKRVEELALEVFQARYGTDSGVARSNWSNACQTEWRNVARALIARYPALAEQIQEEQP